MIDRHKSFKKSFKYALRGLKYAIQNEKNFRFEVAVGLFVVILAVVLRIKLWEFVIIIMMITWVLVAELANTVVERIVDILQPRVHPFARLIKDITAAIVLISAIASVAIGLMIFFVYFLNLIP